MVRTHWAISSNELTGNFTPNEGNLADGWQARFARLFLAELRRRLGRTVTLDIRWQEASGSNLDKYSAYRVDENDMCVSNTEEEQTAIEAVERASDAAFQRWSKTAATYAA